MPALAIGTRATLEAVRLTPLLALLAALLVAAPAAAQAPGPPLETPAAQLEAALECSPDLGRDGGGDPVLLVHGTFTTPEESWDPGYQRVLSGQGFPSCTVDLPGRATTDVQESTEYVVHAIREMSRRAGRKISIVGHSQGTLQPLWALRFWPDIGEKVGEYIGLAGPYQGTEAADLACGAGSCLEAVWQFRPGSAFLRALFAEPLPASVEYTSIATAFDLAVFPQPRASTFEGRGPILVQDICPGRPVDHVALLFDSVTFALVIDALTHPSAADRSRVFSACGAPPVIPGTDLAALSTAVATFAAGVVQAGVLGPQVAREPPLRCYATGTCPAGSDAAPPRLRLTRRCVGGGRLRMDLVGDVGAVRDVSFKLGRRLVRRDTRARFRQVLDRRTLARTDARRLRAVAYVRDGTPARTILSRSLPRCGAR